MNEALAPRVSICIPTYNSEKSIRETLCSIVNQTYRNLDIQIVDNASTDGTLLIAVTFDDKRITINRNETNIGAEGNFNRCIQLANGMYTAIYHADDLYDPLMVEKQVAFMEANPEAGAVFTGACLIDEIGNRIGNIKLPKDFNSPDHLYNFGKIFKAVLRHSNFLVCPSVMVRTEIYQQEIVSWRGEIFKSSADLDVWLRIALRHPVGILPLPLMFYRISNSQGSARVRMQKERADFFRVIDYYLGQSDVLALIEKRDIENYAALERRDSVMRAVNMFLTGDTGEVVALLDDIYSWDALRVAFQSKRGLGVLVAAIYLRILLLLRLNKFGQITLIFLKQVMGK
jgi:glycosyltransferase involved in cell wall biosynthesis